eukprot:6686250-Karenia_brevis.AAC.1
MQSRGPMIPKLRFVRLSPGHPKGPGPTLKSHPSMKAGGPRHYAVSRHGAPLRHYAISPYPDTVRHYAITPFPKTV